MPTESATERLLEDLKAVVHDGGELLKQTAGDLTEKGREARERLSVALDSAKDTIHRLEGKAIAGARATDRVIRDHPYQSLGIAFSVGLLIGVLLHRGK